MSDKNWQNNALEDVICSCEGSEFVFLERLETEKARVIGALAGSLAHELNNPLCGVNAFLERLSRKATLSAPEQQLLDLALEQCSRMKSLLKDIQDFVSQAPQKQVQFDLVESLETVLRLLQKQLKLAGMQVHLPELPFPVLVYGNQQQIRQMLLHLFFAALKGLNDAEGEISLQLIPHSAVVRLVLQFQVAGHCQAQLVHLFTHFFCAQLPLDSDIAIVHSILELHAGRMQATEPVQGIGALALTLPTEQANR